MKTREKALWTLLLLSQQAAAAYRYGTDFRNQFIAVATTSMCVVYKVIIYIAGPIAALFIAYNGLRYITSREDPKLRASARDAIIHTLIALIIIGLAAIIANTILGTSHDILSYC